MLSVPGDQNNLFPNDCLAYDAVDLLYKGTGRVLILNTLLIELVDNSLRNAVRADNKNLALVYLADTLDGTAAMLLELADDLHVVYDRAEGANLDVMVNQILYHAYRAVHSEAEARRISLFYTH